MIDNHARNRSIYRDPSVVAEYATVDGLRGCEQVLFEKYIPLGADVLDLGVGGGRTTRYLSERAGTYVGIDYSEEMIGACRAKYPDKKFLVMDASDMSPLADNSFDVVVFSFNGLSYLHPHSKRKECLAECKRLLREGGVFIFSLPNSRSLFARFKRANKSPSRTLLGILAGVGANLNRIGSRLVSVPFWWGAGYMRLDAHGGLLTYLAAPDHVVRELKLFGFWGRAICHDDFPQPHRYCVTRWYYYVFRKHSAAGALSLPCPCTALIENGIRR
jgi:SAM-dependent methyltransferase